MHNCDNSFFMSNYTHIYIEKAAKPYALTDVVTSKFPHATIVEIDDYMEVFARGRQNFSVQKHAPKLIVAVKKRPFLYPGSEVTHHFGHLHFYYASSALNCLYNCEYCFLQGMFPSGNAVLFVNQDDYFAEVRRTLDGHPLYLSISYESDLLAFEPIVPLASRWIAFAAETDGLTLELRTKSANFAPLRGLTPSNRTVLAWTLSPDEVVKHHEPGTPSLQARLACARKAAEAGWPVRICFDPVLHIDNWRQHYRDCIRRTFSEIPLARIRDVSIGVFRIPKDYLKRMRKHRSESVIAHYPYENRNGILTYPDETTRKLTEFVYESVAEYMPEEKIFTT